MVKFIGEYSAKVDDKGRLIFPAAFKNIMPIGGDMRFVIRKDMFSDCLEMWTFAEWERQSEDMKSRLDFLNPRHAMFWRKYMLDRAVVEPDPKMGRIMIPSRLLKEVGISKEVVFFGNDHKIEIWSKDGFESCGLSDEEYLSIAGELSNMR